MIVYFPNVCYQLIKYECCSKHPIIQTLIVSDYTTRVVSLHYIWMVHWLLPAQFIHDIYNLCLLVNNVVWHIYSLKILKWLKWQCIFPLHFYFYVLDTVMKQQITNYMQSFHSWRQVRDTAVMSPLIKVVLIATACWTPVAYTWISAHGHPLLKCIEFQDTQTPSIKLI